MDIVLHIGLSKCASSTLQKRVFRGVPGYIGTLPDLPLDRNFGKQFQYLCPVGGRSDFDLSGAQSWRNKVVDSLATVEGLTTCILSSENLSSPSRSHSMPIVPALNTFRDKVWTHGNVKVLVVLRNQIDRLGSMYAQFSHARPGAGQSDFQKFVADCIRGNEVFDLDYSGRVEELRKALGPENIRILLLEDMGKIQFWKDLKSFCELDSLSAEELLARSIDRINSRSSSERQWNVRPLEVSRKARGLANVSLNKLGLSQSTWLRERILAPSFHLMFKASCLMHSMVSERSRDKEIVVDDQIEAAIKDHCSEDNRKLQQLLGRDLGLLGYPV